MRIRNGLSFRQIASHLPSFEIWTFRDDAVIKQLLQSVEMRARGMQTNTVTRFWYRCLEIEIETRDGKRRREQAPSELDVSMLHRTILDSALSESAASLVQNSSARAARLPIGNTGEIQFPCIAERGRCIPLPSIHARAANAIDRSSRVLRATAMPE